MNEYPIPGLWSPLQIGPYSPNALNSIGAEALPKLYGVDPQTINSNDLRAPSTLPNIKPLDPKYTKTTKGYNDSSIHLNYNHILASQLLGNIGEAIGHSSPNSYQNAQLRFNEQQYNPLNYLPDNPNVSDQNLYGQELFAEGGEVDPGKATADVKDFYNSYMVSPMYNQMLGDNSEIKSARENQLKNFPIMSLNPTSDFKDADPTKGFPAGRYDAPTNSVMINDKLPDGKIPNVFSHEISHGIDQGGKFIPQKDIDLMNSLKLSKDNTLDATETRAMLMQSRYRGSKNNTFDPSTQQFEKKHLKEYKNSPEMKALIDAYGEDGAVQLMNSVSQTNNTQMPIAKYGGEFNENVEYDLSEAQIKNLIKQGYQIEII